MPASNSKVNVRTIIDGIEVSTLPAKDGPCAKCKVNPRARGQCYCRACRKVYLATRKAHA